MTDASLNIEDRRIPATILTGFLGSGKTTLLNHILRANPGLQIAIIVNELGDVGIDGGLIERTDGDDVLELTAGCICCTIRGDLLNGLRRIFARPEPPDYLIIETTGIAEPLPVAQTFFLPALQRAVRLDGIITLADAEQFDYHLRASAVAEVQLEYANIILLNKADLVSDARLQAVEAAIRERNAFAPIIRCSHGDVDLRLLLDVGAFRMDDRFTAGADRWLADEAAHDHHHLDAEGIGAVSYVTRVPLDVEKVEAFWAALPENVFRGKGVLYFAGYSDRCIFHQVGARVLVELQRPWEPDEMRESRFVFIGKGLDGDAICAKLRACAANAVRA